jgi:hypothetical protein
MVIFITNIYLLDIRKPNNSIVHHRRGYNLVLGSIIESGKLERSDRMKHLQYWKSVIKLENMPVSILSRNNIKFTSYVSKYFLLNYKYYFLFCQCYMLYGNVIN